MQKFETIRQPLLWFWITAVFREVIFRFSEVIFRFSEVIFRFSEVIFQQKCNENSGHLCLCQQPRAAHALRSDQLSRIMGIRIKVWLKKGSENYKFDLKRKQFISKLFNLFSYFCYLNFREKQFEQHCILFEWPKVKLWQFVNSAKTNYCCNWSISPD